MRAGSFRRQSRRKRLICASPFGSNLPSRLKVMVARSPVWVKNSFSDRSSAAAAAAVNETADAAMAVMPDAFAIQRRYTDAVRESADAAEGARAFVEKRPPVWQDA